MSPLSLHTATADQAGNAPKLISENSLGFPWGLTQSLLIYLSQKNVFCSEETNFFFFFCHSATKFVSGLLSTDTNLRLRHQLCFPSIQTFTNSKGSRCEFEFTSKKTLSKYQPCWFLHTADKYRNEETFWWRANLCPCEAAPKKLFFKKKCL